MQAIDRRISAARQAAHESRGPADQRELRRPGAERRGGQGAREGKSVARPARRSRRETQIARLLVTLLAGLVVACASQGAPPGRRKTWWPRSARRKKRGATSATFSPGNSNRSAARNPARGPRRRMRVAGRAARAPKDVVAKEREKEKAWRDQRDVLAGKLK